jgi:hypothetical protein
MCTVTYIPHHNGFLLTSSRDERFSRPAALPPALFELEGRTILYPKDPEANGTWIALSDKGSCWCLLNGGLVPHLHQPPYVRSRGLVLIEATAYNSLFDFMSNADLKGVEPFTLVQARIGNVEVLIWDGEQIHWEERDPYESAIWSSVSLYTPASRAQREEWFRQWLENYPVPDRNEMLDFHRTAGNGDQYNDIQMNREGIIFTQSITSVQVKAGKEKDMLYIDLLSDQQYSSSVGLSKA